MEVGESGFGVDRELGTGDELLIVLPENPTTGFRWQVTCSGDGDLQAVDDRFEPGSATPLPGAAGRRVLRYVARKPGTVQLLAVHQRSWEATAERQKQLTVVIR